MSSSAADKKPEGSGGPKKEKKRRLILSDSDSDSEEHPDSPPPTLPRNKAAPRSSADGLEAAGSQGELKADNKKIALSSDAVNQPKEASIGEAEVKIYKKRYTGTDDVKQREITNADSQNGTDKTNVNEVLKIVKEKDSRSGVDIEQGEEASADRKNARDRRNNGEEGKLNKERVKLAVVFKESSNYNKKSTEIVEKLRAVRPDLGMQEASTDKRKDEEDFKIINKRLGKLDAVKGSEETTTYKKKGTEKRTNGEEPKVERKRAVSSAVVKKREDGDRRRVSERCKSRQEFKDDRKRLMSPNSVNKREEIGSGKKRASERNNSNQDRKVEKKRVFKPDVGKQREEVYSDKKKVTESRSDKEELKFNKKRAVREDVSEQREAADPDKEKATESYSDTEISLKRFKAELKHRLGQTKAIDGKKMKSGYHKHRDERTESKGDQVLDSRSVSPSGEQRDGLNGNSSPAKSEKTLMPEDENIRLVGTLRQRTLRKLKENSVRSVGIKREESGISRDKGIRLQSKGDISAVLSSNKKLRGLEKVHIHREDEDKHKSLTSSTSSTTSSCSTPEHPPLSTAKRVVEKSNSTAALGKVQFTKNSSDGKHKSHGSKRELETSSPKRKNNVLSSRKADRVREGESNSSLKTPLLSMLNPEDATVGRATVKQKIREHIKGILLSAGWKIDLRPRRGRNYEDQVYIPPTGGSAGYWSITKAYAAFKKQSNAFDDENKNLSCKSSKKSTGSDNNPHGAGCSSSAIPAELLSMLKRNVGNKRRTGIEVGKKSGVRGRKKSNSNTKQRGRAPLARGSKSNQEADTEYDDYVHYVWKRTVFSWMIDLGVVPLNGKVKYMNQKQTRTKLEGQIVRDGILCSCCNKILTVSKFEIHAGSKLHQPYENLFVEESGISLLQCQLDAWEKQDESERQGFCTLDIEGEDPNDDACGICGDGGDLICCDGCPSTFHQSCLGIEMLPPGEWHCTNCSCRFCGLVSEDSAQRDGLPDSPLLSCYQCEEKYHQECILEEDAISTISDNSPAPFCGKSCRKVFRRLQKLLGVKNNLEAGLSWRLIRRLDEDSHLSLFGLSKRAECNAKIAVAFAVMDECFLPIIDQRSGIKLIHNVVYNCGSNFHRLNYSGFYTFILERGNEIICAASVRIHGTRLAEMPFIGTRNMYRRQGMCRQLLNGIESALCSLGVRKLIIPAISELKDTWTTVFGFKPLDISMKEEVKSVNLLVFPETGLLHKPLLTRNFSQPADEDGEIEPRTEHHHISGVEAESPVFSAVVPNLHASDEVIVHPEDGVKDVKCISPAVACCALSTSNVVPESLKTPHACASQAPESKSSGNVDDLELFIQPGAVFHDEPMGDQVDSFALSKTKLLFEDIAHNNDDLKIDDVGAASNSYAVEDLSAQHTSEANCSSPDATFSTLPDSGAKALPNLPCTSATLLTPNSVFHCISSGVTDSILRDSGGNDLHKPVSSLESISDATYCNTSDVRSTHSSQAPTDIKDQVTTLQPKVKAFVDNSEHRNSEIITEFMDPVPNNVESNIHAFGEGAEHAIHKARAEVPSVRAKSDANDEDAEPHNSGIIARSSDVPLGKESQASNGSCMTYVCDVITIPVCAASGYGIQVSDAEKLFQQDSEPAPNSSQFLNVALRCVEHSEHKLQNSVDALCLSSLPEPHDSSSSLLNISHETSNGSCSLELNSCALPESSAQYHAPDMVWKSPDVILEPISPASGDKSCKAPVVSTYADAADSLTPDTVNNILGMVAESSTSFVLGSPGLCASVLDDAHKENSGNTSAAPDLFAIPASAKQHSAEGICELDGLCENNDAGPAEALNKFRGSTPDMVQDGLKLANEATAVVSVEPNDM